MSPIYSRGLSESRKWALLVLFLSHYKRILHDQMIETKWKVVGKQQLYHSWKSRMSIRESGSDTIVKVSQHLEILVFAEVNLLKSYNSIISERESFSACWLLIHVYIYRRSPCRLQKWNWMIFGRDIENKKGFQYFGLLAEMS